MSLDKQKIVGRVSDSVTRQSEENVENVGLRSANPTYASAITERTLEDCLDALIDYRGKTPEKTNFGIPLITAKIIKNGRIEKPTEFIAADQYDSWMRRGIPKSGDIVLTVEAPLGEVAQLGSEKIALAQRVVTLRGKTSVLDNTYLLYALQTEEMQEQLKSRATGTTVLGIKQSELRKIRLKLPSISTQISAASTLKALDDRIALLRETNATLEAIAQALFKSWFVDFDPVHANAALLPSPCGRGAGDEGRQSKNPHPNPLPQGEGAVLPTEIAALFPDSFEESELGLIPKGWRIGLVGEYARQHKASVNPLKQPEIKFDHFSLPAFDNGQIPVTEFGATILSNKTTIPTDAVLLSKLNPRIPRIWLPIEVSLHAVCSTEFLVFVPDASASKEFIYCSFSTDQFKQLLCQLVTGTSNSHQRVKPDAVSKMPAVIPSPIILQTFEEIARPLFDQIGKNRLIAQTLTILRDTLLPRLISGQLRLPDAEEAVT